MESFAFTLVLSDPREIIGALEDGLFKAGCSDALLGARGGVLFLDFTRTAESLVPAVLSAIRDVAAADVGARVVRVEPDDLVTISELARRLGRSREGIRLLACGDRGPGTFPPPVVGVRSTSALFSFAEILDWFVDYVQGDRRFAKQRREARFLALLNESLRTTRHGLAAALELGDFLRRLVTDAQAGGVEEALAAIDRLLPAGS